MLGNAPPPMAHSAPSIILIIEAHYEADIIYYITGSSVEIYGVVSPDWRRGLQLQPVSTVYLGRPDYNPYPLCIGSARRA